MKKIISILIAFFPLSSFCQIQNVTGGIVQANKSLLPPIDTVLAPYRTGEIRTKVASGVPKFFVAISTAADKKWAELSGSTVLSGTGAPDGSLGIEGNYYIDTASGRWYKKTGSSTWTVVSSPGAGSSGGIIVNLD